MPSLTKRHEYIIKKVPDTAEPEKKKHFVVFKETKPHGFKIFFCMHSQVHKIAQPSTCMLQVRLGPKNNVAGINHTLP